MNASSENFSTDGKYLWSKLLEDVQDNTSTKLPQQRQLLIMGDEESGKTTLTAYLHGANDSMKGYGLEYQYINIKDEYHDDDTKLSVYTLGSISYVKNLIKYALNESNFGETMALIVVSMQEPWSIMDSLHSWYEILRNHCELLQIDTEIRNEYKQSLVRYFQEYVEPPDITSDDDSRLNQSLLLTSRRHMNPLHPQFFNSFMLNNGTPTTQIDANQEHNSLPLPVSVLEHNLGIPLIVVLTKTDLMDSLAKEYNLTEEHFEVIQMHIRKFCLARGAALIYTSVKEKKNFDLLKGYIKNRIYGIPFVQSAYIVEKDCVFVPTGWDNLNKITLLGENLLTLKDKLQFSECIHKPLRSKLRNKDVEITATDEQSFLESLGREIDKNKSKYVSSPDVDNYARISNNTRPTHKLPYTNTTTVNKEGVLANFFKSLLNKNDSSERQGSLISGLHDNDTLKDSNGVDLPKTGGAFGV